MAQVLKLSITIIHSGLVAKRGNMLLVQRGAKLQKSKRAKLQKSKKSKTAKADERPTRAINQAEESQFPPHSLVRGLDDEHINGEEK